MRKPYIIAIDDDLWALRAVERDLKAKFSSHYRVLSMPFMSGTEFLQEAIALRPQARRVLLTAYADSSAAIDAINKVKLNHCLMKPWEPPEQHLDPVLADQLEDWQSGNREASDGVYVVGRPERLDVQ